MPQIRTQLFADGVFTLYLEGGQRNMTFNGANVAKTLRERVRGAARRIMLAAAARVEKPSGVANPRAEVSTGQAINEAELIELLDRWTSRDYWSGLSTDCRLCDQAYLKSRKALQVSSSQIETARAHLRLEGYLQLPPIDWAQSLASLRELIVRLNERGIPLPFAFVYDDLWCVFGRLSMLLEGILGAEYQMLPCFWVWLVDPRSSSAGWRPHRDRDYRSVGSDGLPAALSVWIPITDATPLNGCMYIVPADRDPTYGTHADTQWRFDLPDIRALPAAAGSVLAWNQALIHWGARASPRATEPRISIAAEFQTGTVPPYESPLLNPRTYPSFEARLALVGSVMRRYSHMYDADPLLKAAAARLEATAKLREVVPL